VIRLPRILPAAIVLAASALTLLLPIPALPAVAADVTLPAVRIVIDSLSPEVAGEGGVLRVHGRLVSTAGADLTDVSIQVRRSTLPLTDRSDVATTLTAGLDPAGGEPAALAYYGTRKAVTASLAPAAQQEFSIKVPLADLGLPTPGTYVIAIEALGVEAGIDTAPVRKGIERTFLPWYPTADSIAPIDLVWLWPLADWPARTASGLLLNDRTPMELSPGGRLDRLLTIGERFRGMVSWIADPALLQGAADMSKGYQVMRDGVASVGDRQEQAKRWLERLTDATRGAGIRALPYADVDATAVTRAKMSNDVVRAVTQGPAIASAAIGSPVPGNLYWAPFGRVDRATANVLASAGVTDLIMSSDALPPTDQSQPTEGLATAALPTSVGTMRAVLADPGLSDILAMPQRTAADVIAARQQFLAETALIAEAIPADQSSRTIIVAPHDVRWNPSASLVAPLLRATRSAPWLSPQTLAQLLAAPAVATSRQRGGYGEKAREAELSQEYMATVHRTTVKLESFTAIIDDPTGVSEPFSAALLRAESAAWRTSLATGGELVTTTASELSDQMGRVHVLSEGTITFSGDSGRVPVTITNDLDRSVTVGLTLTGMPSVRLESEPLDSIRIEAGKMASVDIVARVVGGDPLTVGVQLLTPDGATYGNAARITVTSTAYSRAAAYVVALAFLAILVFVLVGVVRRIRTAQVNRSQTDLRR
jgi:hypothetical protein